MPFFGGRSDNSDFVMTTDFTPLGPENELHVLDRSNREGSPDSSTSSTNDLTSGLIRVDDGRVGHGLTGRLALAIAAAALGSSFQHGYNTGVVNAPQKLIEEFINQTHYERTDEAMTKETVTLVWSWTVSIFCVGGMIGGSMTGLIADRFGRQGGLLLNNIFAVIAAALEGFSKMSLSYEMIIAGRFFIGLNSGLNAGLAPMYLSEISPLNLRGAVGTVYQLVITISILLSQILGMNSLLGSENNWPILLGITIVPAIFQLCTLPFCPESPKYYLLNCNKEAEAQRALEWLRGSVDVQDEMEEMRNEYEAMKLIPKPSFKEMIINPALRAPLTIAVMMMIAQQLSGINAVIFFSTEIFKTAGLTEETAQYSTMGMGAMNVLMTVISLVLVEKAGRKFLMLVGLIAMLVITVLLTLCLALKDNNPWLSYLSIILVILFVVGFATGPGSIPWFLVTELFQQGARPMATSIAVAVNWTANFIVGLGFLPLAMVMGPYVFIIFSVLLLMSTLFTYYKVPETKNKTIEEITAMFRQESYQDREAGGHRW